MSANALKVTNGEQEIQGVHVKLTGVQGEPFGKYTPMATCEMVIHNEAVAKLLLDNWLGYTQTPGQAAPEYMVEFRPVDE